MAKQKSKKKIRRLPFKQIVFVLAILVVAAAACTQIYFDRLVWQRTNYLSAEKIRMLIISAVENLHDAAPVDATTGRVYIREARLVLPEPDQWYLKGVRYNVNLKEDNKTVDEASIITRQIATYSRSLLLQGDNIDDLFGRVPEAQTCSRGVHVRFTPLSEADTKYYVNYQSKKLADGRTIYVYTENGCHAGIGAESDSGSLKNIAAYVLKAESF